MWEISQNQAKWLGSLGTIDGRRLHTQSSYAGLTLVANGDADMIQSLSMVSVD